MSIPAVKRQRLNDSTAVSSSALSKQAAELDSACDAFLELCSQHPHGLLQTQLTAAALPFPNSTLVSAINRLLSLKRIEIGQERESSSGDGKRQIVYHLVSREESEILRDLSEEEALIYKIIAKEGNKGIWIKLIKQRVGHLPPARVSSILTRLVNKKLIKTLKSIEAFNKKVYMLYHLEASTRVTGGCWYDSETGEFDEPFKQAAENGVLAYFKLHQQMVAQSADDTQQPQHIVIKGQKRSLRPVAEPLLHSHVASAGEILTWMKAKGFFKQLPSEEELEQLCEQMCAASTTSGLERSYESRATTMRAFQETKYRLKTQNTDKDMNAYSFSAYSQIPCCRCPVRQQCHEGTPVDPAECHYFTQWGEI